MKLAIRLLRMTTLSFGGLGILVGLVYVGFLLRRPARTSEVRSLFKGIEYERYARQSPRPLMFHIVTIDLTAPNDAGRGTRWPCEGAKFAFSSQSTDEFEARRQSFGHLRTAC